MASTFSPNLRLELIGTGEQQGTWGTTTNTNLGTLLEEAIGGYTSVTVSDLGDTTLTTNNGSSDQSRNMVINLTGSITGSRNVICPAIEKLYVVKNATSGGHSVTFKVSGQTGVSIPSGSTRIIYVNGSDANPATGTMALQESSNVSITGGVINGVSKIGVGTSGDSASVVAVASSITGATTAYGTRVTSAVQPDVVTARYNYNVASTASNGGTPYSVNSITQYYADQGTFSADSTVTIQSGFFSRGLLTGATSNYAFYAANTESVGSGKSAYGFYHEINVATGGGTTWGFYGNGTAHNYFGGQTAIANTLWQYAPDPTSKSSTATLTAAELRTAIINTTGTSYTITLPLGTSIETSFAPFPSVNIGFDFYIINTASGTITLAVNTGITSLGSMTIATGVSAHFRLRRTSANTYVVYRLS